MSPERVEFISLEQDGDLILSFAIASAWPGDVVSLTLLRTPKYEMFLYPEERGVSVMREDDPNEEEKDLLQTIRWKEGRVEIATSTGRRFKLDVRAVPKADARRARRILTAMNFDQSFELAWG